jgi:hypothetical protein
MRACSGRARRNTAATDRRYKSDGSGRVATGVAPARFMYSRGIRVHHFRICVYLRPSAVKDLQ